jgi:hypothetical protein
LHGISNEELDEIKKTLRILTEVDIEESADEAGGLDEEES